MDWLIATTSLCAVYDVLLDSLLDIVGVTDAKVVGPSGSVVPDSV